MVLITVIIPTQNRPVLLEEALQSLKSQTLPPGEIIVVDDGSIPPVDAEALIAKFSHIVCVVCVIRNEEARGLAFARNRGVEAATGEYVVHLDDDDLLSPGTLSDAYALLSSDPQLDLVFLGAQGFGSRSDHFNRVQPEAITRVIALGMGQEAAPGLVYFGRELLGALLHTVPIAFQRVMLKREMWDAVSALRWRAHRLDSAIRDNEAAKRSITGPLRDSEWALYAGVLCHKTALINQPLYLQRCEGQGYSSQPANQEHHMLQGLAIKTQLFQASISLPEFHMWKKQIRKSLAAAQFSAAYHYFQIGKRGDSWRHLKQAFFLSPNLIYGRFALRMWLPRSSKSNLG